jgi:GrpB-like predicted nucleotidyltransferase (UPF0157 family)
MPIHLAPFDARWADAYKVAAARISASLGSIALRVEHVGSTAIPGMLAKPVVDVLVLVRSYDPEEAYVTPLSALGYSCGHRDSDHVFLTGRYEGFAFHLHVVEAEAPHSMEMVTFRDYMRTHPGDAASYVSLKQRLAEEHDRGDDYAAAKTTFVREILRRAATRPR